MSERARTPELVLLLVIGLLAAGALALGDGGEEGTPAARAERTISPERIALVQRRVERLRGLRFRRRVPVEVVSAAQVRRHALAEDRRLTDEGRERGQVEALKLLGMLGAGVDFARLKGTIYAEQIAGVYDTRAERLMLVRGAGVDEVTLAHELTHALEDQHFDIDRVGRRALQRLSDDELAAHTALVEGTATELMVRYMLRYPETAVDLDAALGALDTTPLPPYVMRGLLFPYLRGQTFVAALRQGRRSWALVDLALRYRPPVSTAEVLEPQRWLRVARPAAVRLPDAARVLGAGWRRAWSSTFGQFETVQLLFATSGSEDARRIAGGWDGGRYALWRRGGWRAAGCAAPCRERDALTIAWRVEEEAAAGRLRRGLARWLARGLGARREGEATTWRLPDGSAAAVRTAGREVRVALAPVAAQARALTAAPR